MKPTTTAILISAISLGVSLLSVLVNVIIWKRSGHRLKVKLRRVEHAHDRLKDALQVEVTNIGRQTAVVRGVSLGKAEKIGQTPKGSPVYMTVETMPLFEDGAERLELAPSDFKTYEVSMERIVDEWGADEWMRLRGIAERGDGKNIWSGELKVKTPGRPDD